MHKTKSVRKNRERASWRKMYCIEKGNGMVQNPRKIALVAGYVKNREVPFMCGKW